MGEIRFQGTNCIEFLNILLTTDLRRMSTNQASYCLIVDNNGGIIDDIIAYKVNNDEIFLCVNSVNIRNDFYWFLKQKYRHGVHGVKITNESDYWGQVAIQGPKALNIISELYSQKILVKKFYIQEIELPNSKVKTIIARTGYTGEDGCEIFVKRRDIKFFLNCLRDVFKVMPFLYCGLSSRDSLRVEAGLFLHGNDIHRNIDPLSAGLEWTIKYRKKENFIGKNLLLLLKKNRVDFSKIIGIKVMNKRIARKSDKVLIQNIKIGSITSGVYSPYLKHAIGFAYLTTNLKDFKNYSNTNIFSRKNKIPCKITKPTFLKRGSQSKDQR